MIEIIETKDYKLLAELNEEVQTLHHTLQPEIFKPFDKEAITRHFETTVKNENVCAYIAKKNELTIGYIILYKMNFLDNPFQYARRFVLIDQISVIKDYKGNGVGKLLLDTAFVLAKDCNINCIELNHWTLNESARRFFKKNKFEYYNEKMWIRVN